MINYSSSLLFRTKCKYCLQPASETRDYSGIDLGVKDLIKDAKQWSPDIFLISSHAAESYLKHLRYRKIGVGFSYFSYARSISVNTRFHRRKPVKDLILKEDCIPKICRCKCAKSYWIVFSLGKEIYPEYNRRSRYKIKL